MKLLSALLLLIGIGVLNLSGSEFVNSGKKARTFSYQHINYAAAINNAIDDLEGKYFIYSKNTTNIQGIGTVSIIFEPQVTEDRKLVYKSSEGQDIKLEIFERLREHSFKFSGLLRSKKVRYLVSTNTQTIDNGTIDLKYDQKIRVNIDGSIYEIDIRTSSNKESVPLILAIKGRSYIIEIESNLIKLELGKARWIMNKPMKPASLKKPTKKKPTKSDQEIREETIREWARTRG